MERGEVGEERNNGMIGGRGGAGGHHSRFLLLLLLLLLCLILFLLLHLQGFQGIKFRFQGSGIGRIQDSALRFRF